MPVAFDFSHQGHALVTLYVQFLCSDWSKFDRWVHAENLCSILKVVYFDRVLCQLVMFLTVFFHWMYKMKFSCYQESSVIHGLFVYWVFGWGKRRLSKSEILFGMASFSFLPRLMRLSLKRFWPYCQLSGVASRMVSLSNYCIWLFFYISNLMKSSVVYAKRRKLVLEILGAYQNSEPAGRLGDYGRFKTVSLKVCALRSSWILNECTLNCKIEKYGKNPRIRTWILRTCDATFFILSPLHIRT